MTGSMAPREGALTEPCLLLWSEDLLGPWSPGLQLTAPLTHASWAPDECYRVTTGL